MNPSSAEILATVLFALAVLHTFSVARFARLSQAAPAGSIAKHGFHFLAETELVFGLWASALFAGVALLEGSLEAAVRQIDRLDFTEPKFVLAVMVVAATRPVVGLAETLIRNVARLLPFAGGLSFYLVALSLGPLLGSFITEPAAMTLLALVLKERYFDRGVSPRLAYATLGLLFVNVSIGGTLTHFAAPPVLMVAAKWDWDTEFMLRTFGWRAAATCVVSALAIGLAFRRELALLTHEPERRGAVPIWLTAIHVATLGAVVAAAHHPDVVFGIVVLFLGVVTATQQHQDGLRLREALLVGFFLAGLVVLGSPQRYWLQPLIEGTGRAQLFFGAIGLTAITDNAALTYLGSLVEGLTSRREYALVAGAVVGGGLTVIANAPNPAGVGILHDARAFRGEGISPLGLFLGALAPTAVGIAFFWFVP